MARKIGAELFRFWSRDDELIFKNMELMKEAGFEVCFFPLILNEPERMESYLDYAKELGLEIDELHEIHKDINLLWADDESGEKRMQLVKEAIDFCASHGVTRMVLHESSGPVGPEMNDVGMNRFREIFQYSNEKGVLVCVENLRRTHYLARIFHENRDLNVGYCWDAGHENCFAPGIDHLLLFGDKLACTHVHDNRGIYCSDDHLLPFDGINDWERDAALIRQCGYKGNICGELKRESPLYEHLSDEEFCKLAYERMKKFVDMCDAED